jgi:predicted cobalt transporter CbtA
MTRNLLVRGMLAGLMAAVLAVLFARLFGEPQVDLAIGFEEAHARAMGMAEDAELVSRVVQKGLGLFTAVALYGAAIGGIFSIVFALVYGRVAAIGPRSLALLLALAAFIAVALAPALKYPPTPPGVGLHETIDYRTLTYFTMIGLSLAGLVMAVWISGWSGRRLGGFNGALVGAGAYVLIISGVLLAMPAINEVPVDFPSVVLWKFRIAALGIQAVLWTTIGVSFGLMAEHVLRRSAGLQARG